MFEIEKSPVASLFVLRSLPPWPINVTSAPGIASPRSSRTLPRSVEFCASATPASASAMKKTDKSRSAFPLARLVIRLVILFSSCCKYLSLQLRSDQKGFSNSDFTFHETNSNHEQFQEKFPPVEENGRADAYLVRSPRNLL